MHRRSDALLAENRFRLAEACFAIHGARCFVLRAYQQPQAGDAELLARWSQLFEVRSAVQKALEEKRNEKVIGASLEAHVTVRAGGDQLALLTAYADQLADIFIVSAVTLEGKASGDLEVTVAHADGAKCERCWHWGDTVGADARFPTIDARCVRQIEEGWL